MNRQGQIAKPYTGLNTKLRPGLIHGDNKRLTLSYLCILLIINAHDTETNPGPCKVKFPCHLYTKAMKLGQKGIRCDCCDGWYHTDCMNMGSQTYEYLGNSRVMWICPSCGLPNYFCSALFSNGTIELRPWQNNCSVQVTYGSESRVGWAGKCFILDKNFNVARYYQSGKMVQNSEVWHHTHTPPPHTHTQSVADNTLFWVWGSEHGTLLFGNFHYISDKNMHVELYYF